MSDQICQDCGSTEVRFFLSDVALCDRCFDQRISKETGFPPLGDPPAPISVVDLDGRTRSLRFRCWRAATGIEVEIEEVGAAPGDGYHRAVLGAHDADVGELASRLRALAEADLAHRFLEPNPHRPGWLVVDDVVEGRLEWNDNSGSGMGTPYDVVVDGRRLSWDELGRALEAYEGWRFRIELTDRVDDLRPDAAVISLPAAQTGESPVEGAVRPLTIDVLLKGFLADQQARLAARTFANYRTVVDLLRSCLNNYGHQHLDAADQQRFQAAYERDDEAFVHLFGAEELVEAIPEFLGYFMVRKVMAGAELLRAAGTVSKKLAKWLGERGYLDTEAVAEVVERGTDAARDLPRAERLSTVLFDLAHQTNVDVQALDDDDYIEDYLSIDRVEPGALWFEGGIGPVKVPTTASDLAQPGWSLSVVLARTKKGWQLVETGVVYP